MHTELASGSPRRLAERLLLLAFPYLDTDPYLLVPPCWDLSYRARVAGIADRLGLAVAE